MSPECPDNRWRIQFLRHNNSTAFISRNDFGAQRLCAIQHQKHSRCCGCSFIGRNCTLSFALILGYVIANLLLNRGETLNRKCRRSNRARCAQSSIENSFRRRGRGRATPSSSSRGDSLIDRCYPQWWRFTLTSPRLEYAWRCLQHIICFFLE